MTTIRDAVSEAAFQGRIAPFTLNKATGQLAVSAAKSNVIVYTAADLLARMLSGDQTYLPRHVGFIYGSDASPLLDDPDLLPSDVRRVHDWTKITSDVAAIGGNMVVVPFAQSPAVARDGSASLYTANAVTFCAHTGLSLEYAFDTTGGTYARSLAELQGEYGGPVYFYQVVLLNRWESGGRVVYTPFARTSLGAAPFDPKPAGQELGVFWTITFK